MGLVPGVHALKAPIIARNRLYLHRAVYCGQERPHTLFSRIFASFGVLCDTIWLFLRRFDVPLSLVMPDTHVCVCVCALFLRRLVLCDRRTGCWSWGSKKK